MSKKDSDHIILDYSVQPPQLRCGGCKETFEINLPMSISMFISITKQFTKEHKICNAKNKGILKQVQDKS